MKLSYTVAYAINAPVRMASNANATSVKINKLAKEMACPSDSCGSSFKN